MSSLVTPIKETLKRRGNEVASPKRMKTTYPKRRRLPLEDMKVNGQLNTTSPGYRASIMSTKSTITCGIGPISSIE